MGALTPLALGVVAGTAIGAAIGYVETSRIAFGPYALFGNGAFAVPEVLGPPAIFAGWAWATRRYRSPAVAMTAFAVGAILGNGIGYGLASGGLGPGIVGPIIGFGLFFVGPIAVLAALTIVALRTTGLGSRPIALATTFVGGALLGAVPPLSFFGGLGAIGISVGAGVVACARSRRIAVVAVGAALTLLAAAVAFALPLFVVPIR